jgi:hypothetical protein
MHEGTSSDFFTTLRETVALTSRRPDQIRNAGTLGDILGEYLQDLPYNSEILNYTPSTWRDLDSQGEQRIIDSLKSKIVALTNIHNDANRWVALAPGSPDGEHVTVVPLSLMP